MKEWNNAEITELDLKCTENGSKITPYVDEIRTDAPDGPWYAFSGIND